MDRGYDREFIIVDKTKLSGEEDQFKDATVFYHHPQNTMAEPEVVNKYSQLVGLATLHYHWFGTFPVYIKLVPVGCAVKQLGQKHLMMLASRTEEPQEMTIEYLNVIHDLFTFYHQSVSRILKLARKDWMQFIVHMKEIFSTIIALVCHVPFLIPTVFHSLPYLELPKKGMPLFVSASRLLRECQLNRFVIGGLIVHNKKIVCSQLPANIVKKLCMVAQVEYDARHSDLVHDMTKVFKIALEGDIVLKLHNLWVLEVFLTEQEVADIKQCRANLLERSTVKHTLNDAGNKRLENTRSPRPYGSWRRNITAPSFRTGLVAASEKASDHSGGLSSLASPPWTSKRKQLEAVPSPVEGYHIEPESQKEATTEVLPEKNTDHVFCDDKVDNKPEVTPPIEVAKESSKTSIDSYYTPPTVASPKHRLAAPDLEDIEDITLEEPTSDVSSTVDGLCSMDTALLGHISSTSTLVKSAEMSAHTTLDHPDTYLPSFQSNNSDINGSSSNCGSNDSLSQSQLPEDSSSLKTAYDSQSHYGSVDEDRAINPASLSEEISKLKVEEREEILVEERVVHENGWASMDTESKEPSNSVGMDMPQTDKKQEFILKNITKKVSPELHTNCINHDNLDVLLPDGDSPNDIITSSNIVSSPKLLSKLLDHKTLFHDQVRQEGSLLVDSGNCEDAGVSPTLSSVSCSDGRSSCHSSNLYTPQTASSEVQDNELSDEHDTSHLIQLCAYVQCYQDTVTILLGDSELSEDVAGLEALWNKIMPPLYNLQAELKNLMNKPYTEMLTLEDCAVNAPFWAISYYDKCKRCKASPPVVSFQFRHAVRSCHLEYKSDPGLSQISLWKEQSKLVSQKVKQCEHYFYPNTGLYNHHSFTHPVAAHVTMETLAKAKSKQTNKIFIM